jgi:undecaprenyl-diphosphatase
MDLWLLFTAAVLGLVEGVTEFIPVSSTGHLILVRDWLNWTDARSDAFIIWVQFPAILAVVWHFRTKVWEVASTLHSRPQSRRLLINLVLGTLPLVLIGLPTDDWVEENLYSPFTVAVFLILGGFAILAIERWRPKVHVHTIDDVPMRLALGVGLIQVLSVLFPGTSRAAATIMGGLVLGFSRVAATEFSFFLALPALTGATMVKMWGARDALSVDDIGIFLVGGIVSFVSALFVIRALLRFVETHTFNVFAWYRMALGLLIIVWYWNATGGTTALLP